MSDPEDGEIKKTKTSGVGMKLICKELCKTRSINMEVTGTLRPHHSLRDCWQLMVGGGAGVIFFSKAAPDEVPLI